MRQDVHYGRDFYASPASLHFPIFLYSRHKQGQGDELLANNKVGQANGGRFEFYRNKHQCSIFGPCIILYQNPQTYLGHLVPGKYTFHIGGHQTSILGTVSWPKNKFIHAGTEQGKACMHIQ